MNLASSTLNISLYFLPTYLDIFFSSELHQLLCIFGPLFFLERRQRNILIHSFNCTLLKTITLSTSSSVFLPFSRLVSFANLSCDFVSFFTSPFPMFFKKGDCCVNIITVYLTLSFVHLFLSLDDDRDDSHTIYN